MKLAPPATGILIALILAALASQASELEPQAATWPQWRGPNRDGQIQTAVWPKSLSADVLQQSWRVPLGPSYSGPIVAEDRVFVTETRQEKYEVVRAFDRASGKQIWQTDWEGAMNVPFFANANGDWIRATPAYDGERLYVAGMRDVLVCLDARSGERLWKVDFVDHVRSPLPKFGCVSSPVVIGNSVFIQAGASLAKLDKLTGEIVWRALRDGGGMYGSAFSSPVVANLHGRQQLVVQTRSKLAGVDMETGAELWSRDIPAFRGMNILTPTIDDDRVFTSSYGGGAFLLQTRETGSSLKISEAWKNKAQAYMSSPVVIGGHVYLHLRNQRFCCLDLASGKTKWTTKPFGKYWSMVAAGNQILALDERGELLLIEANPTEFTLVDRRQVSDQPTWAHLAVCGQEIFIRELNAISTFRWTATPGELTVGLRD